MWNRIFASEQVLAKDFRIRRVVVSAVLSEITVAISPIETGQAVPWHARMHVMHDVKVVHQKEDSQWAALINYDRSTPGAFVGLMFEEGSNT